MNKKQQSIAIKGMALLLIEKANGIEEICKDIRFDGDFYDSQLLALNTILVDMQQVISSLNACKHLPYNKDLEININIKKKNTKGEN